MSSGAPVREEAIVLRTLKLGETSKIVTALTPTYGRIKVVAKGSRKVGSRLGALLEPGNELELLVYARDGRDLWLLSDAALRRAALTSGNSLDKLSHLLASLELADRLLPEQQALPELESLYRSFLDLWHHEDAAAMSGLFFGLELALLVEQGLQLVVATCGQCGTLLREAERATYLVREGYLHCAACAGPTAGRWLGPEILLALARLDRGLPEAAAVELTEQTRAAIGRLLHDHMTFHVQNYRIPRALYWLAPDRAARENSE